MGGYITGRGWALGGSMSLWIGFESLKDLALLLVASPCFLVGVKHVSSWLPALAVCCHVSLLGWSHPSAIISPEKLFVSKCHGRGVLPWQQKDSEYKHFGQVYPEVVHWIR